MFGVWLAGAVLRAGEPAGARSPRSRSVLAATGAVVLVTGAVGVDAPVAGEHRTLRRRHRVRDVDVGDDRRAEADPAHRTPRTSSCSTGCSARCGGKPADPARPPSPNLIPVSLALNAGIYNVLFGLRAGAAIVIMDGFDTRPLRRARRASSGSARRCCRPAAMTMLADDESVTDLAPLRYVRSITAPLSPLQARRFTDKFGVTVLNGYGQAEIGEVIGWTAADAKEHPEKIGAVGRPHPGVAIKVVDEPGAVADRRGRPAARAAAARWPRATRPAATSPTGSTPTGSSTPATSPGSTPTGSCGSRAGPAT